MQQDGQEVDITNGNPNGKSSPWTAARIELLKALWPGDLSASGLALELGGGLTRNAVIGKAHRLGLDERDRRKYQTVSTENHTKRTVIPSTPRINRKGLTHLTRIERMKQQRELSIAFPDRITPSATPADFLNITFDELTWKDGLPSNCRFASAEKPFTFCGQPVIAKSYCASCYPIVYGRMEATPQQIARAAKMRAARWAA